ncbi:MAG TPA: Fe-S cluster assembly protein SufD [Polyangiaceae bacterium]
MSSMESITVGAIRGAQLPAAKSRSLFEGSLLAALRGMPSESAADDQVRARREALEWLELHGLPSTHDEAWRNASISDLSKTHAVVSYGDVGANAGLLEKARASVIATDRALFLVDGIASTNARPMPGVRWQRLTEALSDPRVRAQFGAHVRLDNGFVAANSAGFSDGWCIMIEPGTVFREPLEVCIVSSTHIDGQVTLPRLFVSAGAGSQVRLLERHYSSQGVTTLSNVVTEIVVDEGALVEHDRWIDHGNGTWAVASTAVAVAQNAEYRSWSITGRGRFVRHDLDVRLSGKRAKAVLDGLYYARTGQLVDQHTRVWHEQPEGVTKECYRGVIEDRGRGIFDGIIFVGRGSMQTDARQENRNLLLGPEAIAHTKPHLEIDADDVTCSHGATIGQLDDQQLFYLRARGISEAESKSVLTWAFAKEIVDRGHDECLRGEIERSLQRDLDIVAVDVKESAQ